MDPGLFWLFFFLFSSFHFLHIHPKRHQSGPSPSAGELSNRASEQMRKAPFVFLPSGVGFSRILSNAGTEAVAGHGELLAREHGEGALKDLRFVLKTYIFIAPRNRVIYPANVTRGVH